jgi:hypothetical protein
LKNTRFALAREVARVRHGLRALDYSLHRLVPLLTTATKNGIQREQVPRRRRLSPKARAALVLQGRYMGFMRQLKPRQKAQVRRVKEARGVVAAIAMAKRTLSE